MKIQAISPAANNYQTNSKAPTFNAFWLRCGQNYWDTTKYHSAIFIPLKNGIQTPVQKFYKGSPVVQFASTDLTVEESKDAFSFLFKNNRNEASYNAVKKLETFVESLSTKDHKHNTLFIEENDVADVSKARKEIKLADITAKILDYEKENHLVKEKLEAEVKPPKPFATAAELQKYLTENGVA